MDFFANLFGYLLNFLYEIFKNYGIAIIIFSIVLKIILLPMTIKQQKTMKKSAKIQKESKSIQEKYKSDPMKMNQEIMALYKRENMSPFGRLFKCNSTSSNTYINVLFSKKPFNTYEKN